jgi:sulfur-carrier protein
MTTDTGSSTAGAHTGRPALLCLHGPLRQLAGGQAQHELEGSTVIELLRALERAHPEIAGWILDERGRIRRHINVFVAGELGSERTAVQPGERVEVLPAITGGSK